jgi:hypothetical protein
MSVRPRTCLSAESRAGFPLPGLMSFNHSSTGLSRGSPDFASTVTLLLGQGVHPRVVMETLGHSQVSLTLDTYSHVLLQEEAAKRMEDAIGCQIGCQEENSAADQRQEIENSLGKEVTLTFASWNQIAAWLLALDRLRAAAELSQARC